jgi:hypothetical protein
LQWCSKLWFELLYYRIVSVYSFSTS